MKRPCSGPKQASIEPEHAKSQRLGIGSRDEFKRAGLSDRLFFPVDETSPMRK